MKLKYGWICGCGIGLALSAGACSPVRINGPAAPTLHPKPAVTQAKKSLVPNKLSVSHMPEVLGGIIKSDSWVIYKDKQQEEFKGHVSYDSEQYVFRADEALSDRARGIFQASGDVFLRHNAPNGVFYQAQATNGFYNYRTQKGELVADGKNRVKLVYRDEKQQTVTGFASRVKFDLNKRVYVLEGRVRVERPSAQGMQVITARKMTLRQDPAYALLEGNATVQDEQRTLTADTLIYDGAENISRAYGGRVLARGTTERGPFAIIADQIRSDNDGKKIELDGQVQGWLVSPQINEAKFNEKF